MLLMYQDQNVLVLWLHISNDLDLRPLIPDEINAEIKYLKIGETLLNEVHKRFKDNAVSDRSGGIFTTALKMMLDPIDQSITIFLFLSLI